MASNSSFSSPSSSEKNLREQFLEAMAEGGTVGPKGYLRLDWSARRQDTEYPEPYVGPVTVIDGGRSYTTTTIVNAEESGLGSDIEEHNFRHQRESRQSQSLFVVAFHLVLLSLVDITLQILLVHCGVYCPSKAVLSRGEMLYTILFPFSALIFLQLAKCCKSAAASFALMCTYSTLFALFFFGICDLIFGPSKPHQDIALLLVTLSICFVLFSLYVYSKNSPACLYLALGILTLTVVLTFSLLLAFPSLLEKLPRKLEAIVAPDRPLATHSVWVSYGTAIAFAVASASLTTLMFIALRRFIFDRRNFSLNAGACSTALEALLRMEMFFVIWPFEMIVKLARQCSPETRG